VYQNLIHIRRRRAEDILILSGDHIYKMDYEPMVEFHRDRRAAVTVAITTVPESLADQFGMVELDPRGRVLGFQEKPPLGTARTSFASMGVYLFRREVLEMALAEDAEDPASSHDFGKDIFPRFLTRGIEVYAHLFPHYWQDVGTLDSFYKANLELVSDRPPFELADPDWIVHTVSLDQPPVRVGSGRRRPHPGRQRRARRRHERALDPLPGRRDRAGRRGARLDPHARHGPSSAAPLSSA
jgi:glucose-1-phosphate adenylyltransferase